MKVLLYARVSTETQTLGHSLEAQLQSLNEYASDKGYEVVGEYVDRGISGRSDDREAFLAMICLATTVRSGIDAILVHKFDRFSRNREDAIFYKALLKKHGVSVISITEPVEDSPAGLLVEGILETIAEFYSRNLAEEVRKGQSQAARKGQNQSEAPLGYRSNHGSLEIDPSKAEIVKYIFDSYLQKHSYRKIASNVLALYDLLIHPSTVSYILRNEVYIGHRIWNKHRKDGSLRPEAEWIKAYFSHEAIIEEKTFTKVHKLLAKRARIPKIHLFSGLCKCKHCAKTLHCHSQKSSVRLQCPTKHCIMGSIKESKLENSVFENIALLLHHSHPNQQYDLLQLDQETKRLVLLNSIEKIVVDSQSLEIHYLTR